MNLLVPHDWLTQYLETDVSPQTLQKELSLRGPSVEKIIEDENGVVYDMEITTNRVDSMNMRGLAREAGAIFSQTSVGAKFINTGIYDNFDLAQFKSGATLPLPKVTVETDKVNRVLCVVLDKVAHAPTPDYMARRLLQVEEHVHDAIVDITNYITYELGHPCHAFDYDKIMALGGEIVIKIAAAKQKFTTLDGSSYETVGGEVVFTNPQGEIIDLPAIKGTLNTAIDDDTKRVLLWFENLDAMTVRRASMAHAIRTLAATLNEKSVDPHLASDTMALGIKLFQEICGAAMASEIYGYFPAKNAQLPEIKLRFERLYTYLGIDDKTLSREKVVDLLKLLDIKVSKIADKYLLATPPTARAHDLQIEVDLIEEVARLYGYHNLPSTLNFPTVVVPPQPEFDFNLERVIKETLATLGYFEVYTSSLISEEQVLAYGGKLDEHLKTSNPLTSDKVYLRQDFWPSLQEVFAINKITAKQEFSTFEIAKVYLPGDAKNKTYVREEMYLALLSNKNYREVLADLADVCAKFFVEEKVWQLQVTSENLVYATIKLRDLQKIARRYPSYQPINRNPAIIEDLTFTLPDKTDVSVLISKIKNLDGLIKKVELGEIYKNNYTFTLTYQSDKILENSEIAPLRRRIVKTLLGEKIILVGKLPD